MARLMISGKGFRGEEAKTRAPVKVHDPYREAAAIGQMIGNVSKGAELLGQGATIVGQIGQKVGQWAGSGQPDAPQATLARAAKQALHGTPQAPPQAAPQAAPTLPHVPGVDVSGASLGARPEAPANAALRMMQTATGLENESVGDLELRKDIIERSLRFGGMDPRSQDMAQRELQGIGVELSQRGGAQPVALEPDQRTYGRHSEEELMREVQRLSGGDIVARGSASGRQLLNEARRELAARMLQNQEAQPMSLGGVQGQAQQGSQLGQPLSFNRAQAQPTQVGDRLSQSSLMQPHGGMQVPAPAQQPPPQPMQAGAPAQPGVPMQAGAPAQPGVPMQAGAPMQPGAGAPAQQARPKNLRQEVMQTAMSIVRGDDIPAEAKKLPSMQNLGGIYTAARMTRGDPMKARRVIQSFNEWGHEAVPIGTWSDFFTGNHIKKARKELLDTLSKQRAPDRLAQLKTVEKLRLGQSEEDLAGKKFGLEEKKHDLAERTETSAAKLRRATGAGHYARARLNREQAGNMQKMRPVIAELQTAQAAQAWANAVRLKADRDLTIAKTLHAKSHPGIPFGGHRWATLSPQAKTAIGISTKLHERLGDAIGKTLPVRRMFAMMDGVEKNDPKLKGLPYAARQKRIMEIMKEREYDSKEAIDHLSKVDSLLTRLEGAARQSQPYDPSWQRRFDTQKASLLKALGLTPSQYDNMIDALLSKGKGPTRQSLGGEGTPAAKKALGF